MKHIVTIGIMVVCVSAGFACQKSRGTADSSGRLLALDTTVKQQIAEGSDPGRLCAYIQEKGYFPKNSYPTGTKILYSTSYGMVRDAAGQAWGVVAADGTFEQKDMVTTQLLLCPGSTGGLSMGGKCLWKINGNDGYAQLAYDVVCNKRAMKTGAVHPGYSSMKAAHVSYNANTAGQSISGADAIEVTLEGRGTTSRIVFAKGVGLVATLFQESSTPDGTAEVFIDAK